LNSLEEKKLFKIKHQMVIWQVFLLFLGRLCRLVGVRIAGEREGKQLIPEAKCLCGFEAALFVLLILFS
jgi:hypothetical protein